MSQLLDFFGVDVDRKYHFFKARVSLQELLEEHVAPTKFGLECREEEVKSEEKDRGKDQEETEK